LGATENPLRFVFYRFCDPLPMLSADSWVSWVTLGEIG
jgi:hypothetical protein